MSSRSLAEADAPVLKPRRQLHHVALEYRDTNREDEALSIVRGLSARALDALGFRPRPA